MRIYAEEDPLAGLRRAWGAAVALAEECNRGPMRGRPREVHFLRLTVKRLRSYLELARPSLDSSDFKSEDRFLRDIGRSLARSRDAIMALRTAERLKRFAKGGDERKALRKLRRRLEESAETSSGGRPDSTQEVAAQAVARLQESAGHFDLVHRQTEVWDLIESGLKRTYARADKRFARWVKTGDSDTAHECRRFAKYLGFQLELLGPKGAQNEQGARRLCSGLAKLQRRFGKMNDLVVLEERLEALAGEGLLGPRAKRRLRRVVSRARKDAARACRDVGHEVFPSRKLSIGAIALPSEGAPGEEPKRPAGGAAVEKQPV